MTNSDILQEIPNFIRNYEQAANQRTSWNAPLVAFADAHDPLFVRLREVVRPSHAVPEALLPGTRSVIVYFLPFHHDIITGNRAGKYVSRQWAQAYVDTNRLIVDLNARLAKILAKQGFRSAILPPTHNFDQTELMSDWSHKHAAYIAGLGRFGLHRLLITEKGCCGRLGSLITDAVFQATSRPVVEFCLHTHNGSCRACVRKCVNGALTEMEFNRHQCYAMLLENAEHYAELGLADACGKCSCGVPCSTVNPVARIIAR